MKKWSIIWTEDEELCTEDFDTLSEVAEYVNQYIAENEEFILVEGNVFSLEGPEGLEEITKTLDRINP